MAALSNKCEAIFAELPKIMQQLQASTHGTDLFDIENGIDHFIGNGIGDQITEAVRDFVASLSEVDNHAHKVGKIDRVLKRCGYSVRECKRYLDEAVKAPGNNEELEEKVSAAWRIFAFSITHLSLLIPMKRIEVLELLGNSGTKSPRDPFPDSVSEAEITSNRNSILRNEPILPAVQHSSGPGSGFSIVSYLNKVRGKSQKTATTTNARETTHTRARSDIGPRKLTKKTHTSNIVGHRDQSLTPSVFADDQTSTSSITPVAGPSNRSVASPPPAYSQITSLSFRDKKMLHEVKKDQKSSASSSQPAVVQMPHRPSTSSAQRPPPTKPTLLSPNTSQQVEFLTPQPSQAAPYIHTQNIYVANATWGPPSQPQQFWAPGFPGFQPSPFPQRFPTPQPVFLPAPIMVHSINHAPVAYKSSMYSLRQRIATEVFDFIKPDATCFHGIRHFKSHSACPCCMDNGCFG